MKVSFFFFGGDCMGFFVDAARSYGWKEKDFSNSVTHVLELCSISDIPNKRDVVMKELDEKNIGKLTEGYLMYMTVKYRNLVKNFYNQFVEMLSRNLLNEDEETLIHNYFLTVHGNIYFSTEELEYIDDMNILAKIDQTKLKDYVVIDGSYDIKYLTEEEFKKESSLEKIAAGIYAYLVNFGDKRFKQSNLYIDISKPAHFYLDRMIDTCLVMNKMIFDSMKI